MSVIFTEPIRLVKVECPNCAGVYAITERFKDNKRKSGGGWQCPYCNQEVGYWESENSKLQKALDEKQRALVASKCETLAERQAREAVEQKLSNLSRRVRCGVCPCCNRSFQNLKRHMKTKHPEAA